MEKATGQHCPCWYDKNDLKMTAADDLPILRTYFSEVMDFEMVVRVDEEKLFAVMHTTLVNPEFFTPTFIVTKILQPCCNWCPKRFANFDLEGLLRHLITYFYKYPTLHSSGFYNYLVRFMKYPYAMIDKCSTFKYRPDYSRISQIDVSDRYEALCRDTPTWSFFFFPELIRTKGDPVRKQSVRPKTVVDESFIDLKVTPIKLTDFVDSYRDESGFIRLLSNYPDITEPVTHKNDDSEIKDLRDFMETVD